ncbi:MAG: hypothetical protein HY293_06880 [Planctomycetes bacterium]|nr:hypothetical protein [Planctomycetota bacterium]
MRTLALLVLVLARLNGEAQDAAAPPKGQRVLSAGHSFHVFVPGILREVAQGAQIKDHVQVDVQGIGGSRVIQHWDLPDEKNKAKAALKTGKVDVFTLSPIFLPDEGIGNFVQLALEHNPEIRLTVQEFWLPYDTLDPAQMKNDKVDRNAMSAEELRRRHEPYFKSMDDHVRELNTKHGKSVVYVVPTGQAVLALREKVIAGQAPGVKTQGELFTDGIGHVRAPIQLLNGYCHYAVIYRKSPVGLPVPGVLAKAKLEDEEKVNRLLQELAWDAVTKHPLSGVKP